MSASPIKAPGPLGPFPITAHVESALRQCIHCGLCLEACPTYRETRLEPDGPRGRIYLMREMAAGRVDPGGDAASHLDLCLGCRACEAACPSGVRYGSAIEWGRQLVESGRAPTLRRSFFRWLGLAVIVPRPWLLDVTAALARFAQGSGLVRLAERVGLFRLLFGASARAVQNLLPPPAPADERTPIEPVTPAVGDRRARVVVLTGCVTERMLPRLNRATVRVLAANGCEVIVPRGQGCCGALGLHAGQRSTPVELARELMAATPSDVDFLVSNAAGCGSTLKEYPLLFEPGTEEHDRARELAAKVRDVSELLRELGAAPPEGSFPRRVGYDDPCHLLHGQGVGQAPRDLLANVPELELVRIPDAEACCGSAGIYNLSEPDMAERVLRRKMDRIVEANVEVVATGNPGCLLQIAAGARARGLDLEVLHPVEILDRCY